MSPPLAAATAAAVSPTAAGESRWHAGTEGKVAEKDNALQADLEKEERVTNELKAKLAEAEAKAEKLQEQLAGTEGAVAEKDKALQAELLKEEEMVNQLKAQLAEKDKALQEEQGQREQARRRGSMLGQQLVKEEQATSQLKAQLAEKDKAHIQSNLAYPIR